MKRFKRLLPIVATLVLVVSMLVPGIAVAASLINCSVSLNDQTPGATANYIIDFTTITTLSACTAGSTYSQFIFTINGATALPASSDAAYDLQTPAGMDKNFEAGSDAPSTLGFFTVTVDDPTKTITIKFCNGGAIPVGAGVRVMIYGVTNGGATGSYPIFISTRDQADTSTDVDTGVAGYILRNPGEVVATVRGELVSVTVNPGGVNYDVLALGAVKNTAQYNDPNNPTGMGTPQTQTLQNNGTVPVDLQIMSSNAMHIAGLGTEDWTLTGTADDEEFTHAYNVGTSVYDGSAPISFTKWTAPGTYVTVATNVPSGPLGSGATRYLELELGMPTATVDYFPHTIVVTVLATAH